MSKYLLIESRDPHESGDVPAFYDLARQLGAGGQEVTLLLIQNGVLAARAGYRAGSLPAGEKGLRIVADDFSLRERGIAASAVRPGVEIVDIDRTVDLLMEDGRKVIWH
jgi:sulfur transfer complex TusBCD TusB component (DsrH family)